MFNFPCFDNAVIVLLYNFFIFLLYVFVFCLKLSTLFFSYKGIALRCNVPYCFFVCLFWVKKFLL